MENKIVCYSRKAKIILFECCNDFGVSCKLVAYNKKSITYLLLGHPVNVSNVKTLFFKNIRKKK